MEIPMKFLSRLFLLIMLPLMGMAATPPAWVNFQGRLLDGSGVPVTQDGMAFTVGVWSDATSTLPAHLKYKESHTVNVNDGVYSFPVGSGTPISGSYGASLYANNSSLWLEITVQGETLTPRHRLLSAPYTNHAGNSENLGGQPAGYFGTAAADTNLQNQINNQLVVLQSLCEVAGNIWEGDKCTQGVKVVNYQGKVIPVDQDNIQIALPNLEKECTKKHYAPVNDFRGDPLPVMGCDSSPIEPPQGIGCAFGPISSATTIPIKDCPFIAEPPKEEPPK
jgi:hypothetical protein